MAQAELNGEILNFGKRPQLQPINPINNTAQFDAPTHIISLSA